MPRDGAILFGDLIAKGSIQNDNQSPPDVSQSSGLRTIEPIFWLQGCEPSCRLQLRKRINIGAITAPIATIWILGEVMFTGGLAATKRANPLGIPQGAKLTRGKPIWIEPQSGHPLIQQITSARPFRRDCVQIL
jgi:hypothetical protein